MRKRIDPKDAAGGYSRQGLGPGYTPANSNTRISAATLQRPEPLKGWDTNWRRYYLQHFGVVFHLVALTFAAVHLTNFVYNKTPYWLLPLLVLPQWLTGLVLGWIRVRRGIGAAILLHSVFNAGPILMIWLVMRYAPTAAG